MKLENSMAVADKVLKEVRRKLVGVKGYSGSIYPYKNGRENGYSILVHSNRSDFPVESRRVFFQRTVILTISLFILSRIRFVFFRTIFRTRLMRIGFILNTISRTKPQNTLFGF